MDVPVMELCVLNPEEANISHLVKAIGNGKSQEWFDRAACWSIVPCELILYVRFHAKRVHNCFRWNTCLLIDIFSNFLIILLSVNTLNIRSTQSQYFTTEEKSNYATSFGHQFWYLLRRKILIELRDPVFPLAKDTLKSIFIGVIKCIPIISSENSFQLKMWLALITFMEWN